MSRPLWFWWLVCLAGLTCVKVPASGLSNLKVYIPDTVLRGHNIQFNCTFTLEDEKLFAIKWYRGNYEIFRYLPSSNVPRKTFPLEGYNVSMQHSTGFVLYMYDAKFINSGAYTCEVIVDTTFDTLMFTKKMMVIDLPDDHPRITGVHEQYEPGEGITATCTSWHSNPPANLSWFINGEPAREAYLRRYNLKENYDDTFTSVLGLHFDVAKYHFIQGEMILKCTSSLLSVYWQSSEVRIRESNFHSSLIQGPQNFDTKIQSGGSTGSTGEGAEDSVSSQNHPKMKKTPQTRPQASGGSSAASNPSSSSSSSETSDSKMPVEQLTSHVLSSSSSPSFDIKKDKFYHLLLAVNLLILILIVNTSSSSTTTTTTSLINLSSI